MKITKSKIVFVLVALLMFNLGIWTDYFLRKPSEHTYLACNTFKCDVVIITDNPMIFFNHPIETTKTLIYSDW